MNETLKDLRKELESDKRFEVEITDGILYVYSDKWAELPFGVPDSVQINKKDGLFETRLVGGSNEQFELNFKETVHYIEQLTN